MDRIDEPIIIKDAKTFVKALEESEKYNKEHPHQYKKVKLCSARKFVKLLKEKNK